MVAAANLVLDLERLDGAVEAAIRAGKAGDLRVLGYGEITLVLGWPTGQPRVAVKRLPGFRDQHAARPLRRAARALRGGTAAARRRRRAHDGALGHRTAGELHAYLVQPLVPAERVLNHVLRAAERARAAALLARWWTASRAPWTPGSASTPRRPTGPSTASRRAVRRLHADHAGRRRPAGARARALPLDLPVGVARPLARVARSIMRSTTTRARSCSTWPPTCIKEQLDRWVPALLDAANAAHRSPPSPNRGATLLRPRQAPVAAHAAPAPRRPRVAAPGAPSAVPVPASPALPLRPPPATGKERRMTVTARPARHQRRRLRR